MPEIELSEGDRRLLRALQDDATLSHKALAEKVGMSASSVWRRLKDFEAAGVILERVTLLDPTRLGLDICVIIHVNVVHQQSDARRDFQSWVDRTDEIVQCYSVTGQFDYTLVVRARSVAELELFLKDRLLEHPSVGQTSTHLVLQQHKGVDRLPV